jgi:hypothetical protein
MRRNGTGAQGIVRIEMEEEVAMGTTASSADIFPPEFLRLLDTARRVIDQHIDDHGTCAYCGSNWPCRRAQEADFALAAA